MRFTAPFANILKFCFFLFVLTLYLPGYFFSLLVRERGANLPPSKNCLVGDRSKVF